MPSRKKKDYAPHIAPEKAPACASPGCPEAGIYKAPKSRDALHDYRWFCLEHIREFNQQWNYFAGLESDEIEHFVHDSVTGHRPTWSRESHLRDPARALHEALYEFMQNGSRTSNPPQPALPAKMRKALAVLNIAWPCTKRELKTQYRAMVKKHHPDVNKGDKASEELFKKVTAAYHCIEEYLQNS